MASLSWKETNEDDGGSVLPRRPLDDSGDMDITPMIDVTFLLLIFFIVTTIPEPSSIVHLPPARHGVDVDPTTSIIVTIVEGEGPDSPAIYLADGRSGPRLEGDARREDDAILQAIRDGVLAGKTNVLIKAERSVLHRHVSRVARLVGEIGDVQLHIAVLETQ